MTVIKKTAANLSKSVKKLAIPVNFCCEVLEGRTLLAITPTPLYVPSAGTFSSSPTQITTVGSISYFTSSLLSGQTALYRTDGTTSGTVAIKTDLPYAPYDLTALNGSLIFLAKDAVGKLDLWRSDGTLQTTTTIMTFASTPWNATHVPSLTPFNGSLYFPMDSGSGMGMELWKTDGTSAGTTLVKDIAPGSGSSMPDSLTVFNNLLYFEANDGIHGFELWQTDGTSTGTVLTDDILSGSASSYAQSECVFNGSLYFIALADPQTVDLFKSDGTAAGTSEVAYVSPAIGALSYCLFPVGNTLYFNAFDGQGGAGLWATDGTNAGTVALGSPAMANPVDFNGALYFDSTSSSGSMLWRTDGSAVGTVPIQSFAQPWTGGLVPFNGALYFTASDPTHGAELWKSDGTTAGTGLFSDLLPGSYGSSPSSLTILGNQLVFSADSTAFGRELWVSDGTPAGTTLIDVNTTPAPTSADAFYSLQGNLYFTSQTPSGYQAIWKTNGQSAATYFTDIGPFRISSSVTVADQFIAYVDGAGDGQLWKLDSTGTKTLLKDFGTGDAGPFNLTVVGKQLMFFAGTPSTGIEPWKSNGTPAGTLPIADINPGVSSSDINGAPTPVIGVWNSQLYFIATDGTQPMVWRTDGTSSGTVAFCPTPAGPAVVLQDHIIFVQNGDNGVPATIEMFDGVTSTPSLLATVGDRWNTYLSTPITFAVVRDKALLFTAFGLGSAYDMWVTDGTVSGTRDLLHLGYSGSQLGPPLNAVTADGQLYFTVSDINGYNLWSSDLTVAGTGAVTTFGWPPVNVPTGVTNADDSLIYSAGASTWVIPANRVAPAAPGTITAKVVAADEIDLSWIPHSNNEDGWEIDRSATANFTTIDRTFTAGVGAAFVADKVGIVQGSTYYYRIRAVNRWGSSPNVSASPIFVPFIPATPSNLVAHEVVPGRQINLTWNDNSNATESGEFLQRSKTTDFAVLDLNITLPVKTGSYQDTTVSPLTQYYYRVIAFNGMGNSGSVSTLLKTLDTIPNAPANFIATGVSATEADLDWADTSTNESSFSVERSDAGGAFAVIATVPTGTVSYFDTTCAPNVQYTYRVAAVNGSGESAYAPTATASTLPPQLTTPLPSTGTPDYFVTLGNSAYYMSDGALWKTDGTPAGTVEIYTQNTDFNGLVTDGKTLFFGDNQIYDQQLWMSNGTAAGTVMIKDFHATYATLRPLAATAGKCYLSYTDSSAPPLLYVSNGTAAGTTQVSNAELSTNQLAFNSYYSAYAGFDGDFYFPSTDGYEYQTDGTSAGTRLIPSIAVIANQDVSGLTVSNGTLYFEAPISFGHRALWKATTPGGDPSIVFDAGTAFVEDITAVSNGLMFVSNGRLYKLDGSSGALQSVATDGGTSITEVNGNAFFLNHDSLYKTDGTTAGTVRIRSYATENNSAHVPVFMTGVGNELFYSDGITLWRSDGTYSGTVQVEQITLPSDFTNHPERAYGGNPAIALGNVLLFSAEQPDSQRQLKSAWSTAPAAPSGVTLSSAPAATPGIVGAMMALSVAAATVTPHLAWINHATNASGLVIDRSTFSNFSVLQKSFFVPANTTSFDDTTAAAGVTYYYRVRAVNAGGNSTFAYVGAKVPTIGSISGTVFNDLDFNGVQGARDTGLAGWKVYLDLANAGKFVSTDPYVLTSANGAFNFANLTPGVYHLREIIPSGWRSTLAGSATSYTLTVISGKNSVVSFADSAKGLISGVVFHDINANGIQTTGEAGLAGWHVLLQQSVNGVWQTLQTAITDAKGQYAFNSAAGAYRILELVQSGLHPSVPSAGNYALTLTAGQSITRNFGDR